MFACFESSARFFFSAVDNFEQILVMPLCSGSLWLCILHFGVRVSSHCWCMEADQREMKTRSSFNPKPIEDISILTIIDTDAHCTGEIIFLQNYICKKSIFGKVVVRPDKNWKGKTWNESQTLKISCLSPLPPSLTKDRTIGGSGSKNERELWKCVKQTEE